MLTPLHRIPSTLFIVTIPLLKNCMMCIFQKRGNPERWGEQSKWLPLADQGPTQHVIPTGIFKRVRIFDRKGKPTDVIVDILHEAYCMDIPGLAVFYVPSKLGAPRLVTEHFETLDKAGFWRTKSKGRKRGFVPHHTTSDYNGSNPGTPGYRNTWPMSLEMIEKHVPKLYKFIKLIESKSNSKVIKHAHITFTDVVVEATKGKGDEWLITFIEHVDKPYEGKMAFRGMLTYGRHPQWREGKKKILRIIDRECGRWVDILCDHGTYIQMDRLYSGLTGRFSHMVINGHGTACLIMDYD